MTACRAKRQPAALALALTLLCVGVCGTEARRAPADKVTVTPVQLGQTTVNVTTETRQGPLLGRAAFINVHSNENTSVVAARAVLYYNGGRLVRLDHNAPGELATRTVSFELGGTAYTFDPNRMFTAVGAAASLRLYGPYSDKARDAVVAFGQRVLDVYGFEEQEFVVALHDNDAAYSAAGYLPGGPFANDAAAVFIAPGSSPHNFVYTTSNRTYGRMAAADTQINAVLQANRTVTDDGSLSYFAGLRGKPYYNSEVRAASGSHGDAVLAQLDTLQRLTELLWP